MRTCPYVFSLHTVGVSVEKRDVRDRVFTFFPLQLSHGTDIKQSDPVGTWFVCGDIKGPVCRTQPYLTHRHGVITATPLLSHFVFSLSSQEGTDPLTDPVLMISL